MANQLIVAALVYIDSLIYTTWIYISDSGMSFRLEKGSQRVIKRGKIALTEGVSLPEGTITDIKKYLRLLRLELLLSNLEGL